MNSSKLHQTAILIVGFIFLTSCQQHTSPSDLLPSYESWSILLGDGTKAKDLLHFEKEGFFYTASDQDGSWTVFKTPNSGITSRTSSNTRTELGERQRWYPEAGGELSATVKVKHVSSSGNASVPAAFSVVIGQIHSVDGHENEPLKIFYKKFPGHEKGSVFWNYEINTAGSNDQRWDLSHPVWGNSMYVAGTDSLTPPSQPENGIALGEAFSYSVRVEDGIMHLEFSSENHPTQTFTQNLHESLYADSAQIPADIITWYQPLGRKGTEREEAYKGELQIFKIGAYNQSNGKPSTSNWVWHPGSRTFNGDIAKQYTSGDFAEVWFQNIQLKHP